VSWTGELSDDLQYPFGYPNVPVVHSETRLKGRFIGYDSIVETCKNNCFLRRMPLQPIQFYPFHVVSDSSNTINLPFGDFSNTNPARLW